MRETLDLILTILLFAVPVVVLLHFLACLYETWRSKPVMFSEKNSIPKGANDVTQKAD